MTASNVVARVGGAVITREAFQREWQRRGATPDKASVLEDLIRFEAALAKAKAGGYDRDPEVSNRFNQFIVARFEERHLGPVGESSEISPEETLDYYRTHADRFAVPEQVRAMVVFWKTSPKAEPERQAEVRRRAEAVAKQARQTNEAGFAQLVQDHSDDQATRYRAGDAGWVGRDATQAHWPPELIEALVALKQPGSITDVVATPRGLYVARLIEHRPATTRPLEEVQEWVMYEVARERRRQREQQYFDFVKSGLNIQINQAVLESIPPGQPKEASPPALPKG